MPPEQNASPVRGYISCAAEHRTFEPKQLLPVALFDDGGVTRIDNGIGGFGCHGDVVVGIGAGHVAALMSVVVMVTFVSGHGKARSGLLFRCAAAGSGGYLG